MKRKICMLSIVTLLIVLVVSCGSIGNPIEFFNYDYHSFNYDSVKYMWVTPLNGYRYDKWDCNDDGFKYLGKVDNLYCKAAKAYYDSNGEIVLIKVFSLPNVWGEPPKFFICNDYYPIDIFFTELSDEVTLDKKSIDLRGEADDALTLDDICDTTVCIPYWEDDRFNEEGKQITLYYRQYDMLSRSFYIYSDDQGCYYMLFDQDYLLKIINSTLTDSLNAEEQR